MKYCILIFSLIVVSLTAARAQESQTLYVNKTGQYVTSLDNAEFIRVLKAPDSVSNLFGVQEYYKNGKIKSIGQCKDPNYINYEGQYLSFHPNGKKKRISFYVNGKLRNEEYVYYPNGNLYLAREYQFEKKDVWLSKPIILLKSVKDSTGKEIVANGNGYFIQYDDNFETIEIEGALINSKWNGAVKGHTKRTNSSYVETYKNGKLISGVSTDSNGKSYPYTEETTSGEFEKGSYSFERLIRSKTTPIISKNNIRGRVFISFTLNESGKIVSAKIDRGIDPELDEQILQVLKSNFTFAPSLFKGMPVTAKYNMPLKFDFEDKSTPASFGQPVNSSF